MVIFRLPIYSETKKEFFALLEKKVENKIRKIFYDKGINPSESDKLEVKSEIEKEHGSGCDYNRAVGWIDIKKGKGGISFSVYSVDSRRKKIKNRLLKILREDECLTWHVIKLKGIGSYKSSLNQIQKILDYIINDCKYFKGCYIDHTSLTALAPFINWKEIFKNQI